MSAGTTMCRVCGRDDLRAGRCQSRSLSYVSTGDARPVLRVPSHRTRTGGRCYGGGAIVSASDVRPVGVAS